MNIFCDFKKRITIVFLGLIFLMAVYSFISLNVNAEELHMDSEIGWVDYRVVPVNTQMDTLSPTRKMMRGARATDTGYYYSLLNDEEKQIYNAVMKASDSILKYGQIASSRDYVIVFENRDSSNIPNETLNRVRWALIYDHMDRVELSLSEICYTYSINTYDDGESDYKIYCYMRATGNYDFESLNAQVKNARNAFIQRLRLDNQKPYSELAIHDALMENITYDKVCALRTDRNAPYDIGHSIYGALCLNECVCDGYAQAFAYILDGIGIDCKVVVGSGNRDGVYVGHAWNIASLDGEWYEVDVTWDDQSEDDKHIFFNQTTTNFESPIKGVSHVRKYIGTDMPMANGTLYTYDYLCTDRNEEPNVNSDQNEEPNENTDQNEDSNVNSDQNEEPNVNSDQNEEPNVNTDQNEEPNANTDQNEGQIEESEGSNETTREDNGYNPTSSEPSASIDAGNEREDLNIGSIIISGDGRYMLSGKNEVTYISPINKKVKNVKIKKRINYKDKIYCVNAIGDNAFNGCKSLKNVSIPLGVTKIGKRCFYNCKNLNKISIRANNVKSVGSGSFKGIKENAKITVICKGKKMYDKVVKKLRKAGAKKAKYKFKKG
ncbi:leucine-rich repeat domain-containing protein [Butyrivibrio sp. AC2005]|uniref:leucine-rich repeat domain-containing protein n=1 Tax=Butyrivibrio sp. AC2005 TaxID=1280672 RepID=UPI000423AB3D|nr:leucine-rich repeat domain-containing protein [Butyrivibrio sp. AC2005]